MSLTYVILPIDYGAPYYFPLSPLYSKVPSLGNLRVSSRGKNHTIETSTTSQIRARSRFVAFQSSLGNTSCQITLLIIATLAAHITLLQSPRSRLPRSWSGTMLRDCLDPSTTNLAQIKHHLGAAASLKAPIKPFAQLRHGIADPYQFVECAALQ